MNKNKYQEANVQLYVRLLSYEEAEKLIDFINKLDSNNYANITQGGVSMYIRECHLKTITEFLTENSNRFEIGNVHPYKVNEQIVNNLKKNGIIE